VAWYRKGHRDEPTNLAPAPAPDLDDSPAGLGRTLAALIRFINQSSGQLPAAAVVNARGVTDALAEIIDIAALHPLDVYALLAVRGTLDDYLPTTLKSYLAVDENLRETVRPSGSTPTHSLLEQIAALQSAARSVLVAVRNQDADALLTQGTFLRTKFSGSDLDL
jgi:hypothetical protein